MKLTSRRQRRLRVHQHAGALRGAEYFPALVVRELPRIGRIHRVSCWRFGERQFHLAADTQFATFLHEYFREEVVDIREQVPAEVERTIQIAMRLGLPHPGGVADPDVLLTDMVITIRRDGQVVDEAVRIKHFSNAGGQREDVEFAILADYWEERGVKLFVALSHGLNSAWARNLLWLYPVRERIEQCGVTTRERHIQDVLTDELVNFEHPTIALACGAATRRGHLTAGEAICAFRQMLATRTLVTDINVASLYHQPPSAFTVFADR